MKIRCLEISRLSILVKHSQQNSHADSINFPIPTMKTVIEQKFADIKIQQL